MDSRSLKRRLEDDEPQETKPAKIVQHDVAEDVNEELPKILSPEVLDVLPVFANMLDVKSFTRLAMTCKYIYKRCNEDVRIKINVNENGLEVITGRGDPNFTWKLKNEPKKHREQYLMRLRQPAFIVTLNRVSFSDIETATTDRSLETACDYLKLMRVKNIDELYVNGTFLPWTQLISFIDKFQVTHLRFLPRNAMPDDTFLSLLRLNLDFFSYSEPVPVNVLLQARSPIPEIQLDKVDDLSDDSFMQILSLIQAGALHHLTIKTGNVALSPNQALPFAFDGPLPDNRPLIFHRMEMFDDDYSFLHWHGGVTKGCYYDGVIRLRKCEKKYYPPVLKSEEEALDDLHEHMMDALGCKPSINKDGSYRIGFWFDLRVSCSFALFRRFTSHFPLIESSYEGPLPTERPLFFESDEKRFYLVNEHDVLMRYKWDDSYAKLEMMSSVFLDCPSFNNPSLNKFVVRRCLQGGFALYDSINVQNVEKKVFESWFEGFKTLPMEYDGPTPEERPLVFEGDDSSRVVLNVNGFFYKCEFVDNSARIIDCPSITRPIFYTRKDVENILLKWNRYENEEIEIRVTMETFHNGFDKFKTIPMDYEGLPPEERPLVFVKTQVSDDNGAIEQENKHRLVITDDCEAINCEWKNGVATFSKADGREFPLRVTELLLRLLIKVECDDWSTLTLCMELETIEKWLSSYKTLPFDYDGPVTEDDLVIFTKAEVKEGCRLRKQAGDWPETMMTIWVLKEGTQLSVATWSEKEPLEFEFRGSRCTDDVPPALKTKEYLKWLILKAPQIKDEENRRSIRWYGDFDEFQALLGEFTHLPYFFNGELPEERPLVFEEEHEGLRSIYCGGGKIVNCHTGGSSIDIDCSVYDCVCPPIIRHLCHSLLRSNV